MVVLSKKKISIDLSINLWKREMETYKVKEKKDLWRGKNWRRRGRKKENDEDDKKNLDLEATERLINEVMFQIF